MEAHTLVYLGYLLTVAARAPPAIPRCERVNISPCHSCRRFFAWWTALLQLKHKWCNSMFELRSRARIELLSPTSLQVFLFNFILARITMGSIASRCSETGARGPPRRERSLLSGRNEKDRTRESGENRTLDYNSLSMLHCFNIIATS